MRPRIRFAGAHSIRELVLHMAAGYHLVLRRLDGDGRQLSPEEDWPASSEPTEDAWRQEVESLFALNRRVREAVATFPATHLDDPLVPDPPYSAFTQFIGLTQHDLYHAGQIMLLRRALGHLAEPPGRRTATRRRCRVGAAASGGACAAP